MSISLHGVRFGHLKLKRYEMDLNRSGMVVEMTPEEKSNYPAIFKLTAEQTSNDFMFAYTPNIKALQIWRGRDVFRPRTNQEVTEFMNIVENTSDPEDEILDTYNLGSFGGSPKPENAANYNLDKWFVKSELYKGIANALLKINNIHSLLPQK